MKLLNMGSGKRTYAIAVLIFVLGGLQALGYIDQKMYNDVLGLLMGAGLFTLRMGMPRKK